MLKLSVEARYKRQKLSAESKHYELLYGIVYIVGETSREKLLDALREALSNEEYSEVVKALSSSRIVRVYIPHDKLYLLLKQLGMDTGFVEKHGGIYDYVLIIENTGLDG